MPKYAYKAKSVNGSVTTGEIDASNQAEAMVRLRAQQLIVVELNLVRSGGGGARPKVANTMFAPRVKSKDLQIFTRQFATLINAGIPVVDALKILGEGAQRGILKTATINVKSQIEQGKRLAEAMAMNPTVFDKLYVNMIQAGEEAGILDGILHRLALYMEKSEKIKSQIKGALVYPAVIIVVSMLVIAGILVFILPKFMEFFSSSGAEPPALTMAVVALSNSLIQKWYLYIGAAVGIPVLFSQWIKTDEGKRVFDKFAIRAPVFGDVILRSSIARMTRTLSTLLSSGVGLIDAIEISARTSGNFVIEEALMRCKKSVTVGKPFSQPLTMEKDFPQMVVQMISIGEQSGAMDIMLSKIADFYEDEVETAVKAMTSLLEPILMVVLGGIIAVLVIAMYLPIFGMADVVGK